MNETIEAVLNGTATLEQIKAWWNNEVMNGGAGDLVTAMAMSRLIVFAEAVEQENNHA